MNSKRYLTRRALPKRNALVVALALGMGISGLAYGQATSGTIFGSAPAGDTVQVVSDSGTTRTVVVPADGNYTVGHLPLGSYTVTLMENGQSVSSRNNVSVQVGGGVAVNFASAQNAQNLTAVQVTANALPSIDVTSVHDSTVITASQLQKLPVGRSMTDIALLTPGTTVSTAFGGVTFGGSSVSENAYYVNGYNTGEPYRNMSGFQLPYGAIAQQNTMSGGFSAKYGRTDGGVISQTGKRGTNEWHFGGQIVWEPKYLAAAPKNSLYPTTPTPPPVNGVPFQHLNYYPGQLYNYNNEDKSWTTVYTAYIGGPLIKDKLFFFFDIEQTETGSVGISARDSLTVDAANMPTHGYKTFSSSHQTRYYGKLDWNINDSNIFEATILKNEYKGGQGSRYNYDYPTGTTSTFSNGNNQTVNDAQFIIAHYTSYITDNATLSVLYGKGTFKNPIIYAVDPNIPYVQGAMNPALIPAGGITNIQNATGVASPNSRLATHGLRADFTYVAGNHTLGIGIDNMRYQGMDQGTMYTGGTPPAFVQAAAINGTPLTGTRWIYYHINDGTPNGEYLARYYLVNNLGGMSVRQNAYYIQDEWQVTPNVLLNIGIRNDHFTNFNNVGKAFVDQRNQWEPRLGVSWDVFGDASLKIYGNAGRYYLALPTNAANRAANSSVLVWDFYTYTGINSDGTPTGLGRNYTPGTPAVYTQGFTSPDGEYGNPKDPKQIISQNLKPMYIDQFNLGFDAKLGDNWTYGAKLSYRDLKATIDDECMPDAVAGKLSKMGYNPDDYYTSLYQVGYCRLINPGRTNQLAVKSDVDGSYVTVPMAFEDWGYPQKPKRRYESLNLYFSHPFDGKWSGRIDYTFTHARGNTTGQVRPDFAQNDVSKTEDWDSGPLMEGQDGELMNTRKHIIRIRGQYQITPEWLVSGIVYMASGTPRECLGYYGPNADGDPTGYNGGGTGNYHWCAGRLVHPGSDDPLAGHTPWTHQINLGVHWMPAFADHKMTVSMDVFNVLNEQKPTQTEPSLANGPHVIYNFFGYANAREAPRYVRLSLSYDY